MCPHPRAPGFHPGAALPSEGLWGHRWVKQVQSRGGVLEERFPRASGGRSHCYAASGPRSKRKASQILNVGLKLTAGEDRSVFLLYDSGWLNTFNGLISLLG